MFAEHASLLSDWKKDAARSEDANYRFLRSLKMVHDPEEIDQLAHELHEAVFARIDCTRCANCCKTMPASLTADDIERTAVHQKMARQEFIEAYLKVDSEEPGQFLVKTLPCPFLGVDDRCTIYEVRPECCRQFPHTDQEGFTSRSYQHTSSTLTCPAVYHIVKGMRKVTKGRRTR